jgi:ectoine/hydroxyectoine ABC transporter permease protein EhuC
MWQNLQLLFNVRGASAYLPQLLQGAVVTIELTISAMALSLLLGLVVALARITRAKAVRAVATFYVEVIRGTPCLLQLFYIYYVLPLFGVKLPPLLAGIIGLTINYSAYISEVYRAGITAVAKGQLEAAQALGMSRTLMMRLIILPQAIRIVVPPLGNHFIGLFKDSALASIVSAPELLFSGQVIAATNFQYFTVFTIIGLIYLVLSYPGSLGVQYLERHMQIGYRPKRAQALALARRISQRAVS